MEAVREEEGGRGGEGRWVVGELFKSNEQGKRRGRKAL